MLKNKSIWKISTGKLKSQKNEEDLRKFWVNSDFLKKKSGNLGMFRSHFETLCVS